MIGRQLSHYRILEKIGQGGMGEVYLAEDPSLRRKVALKVLPTHLASDQERRLRFQREAQSIAALNHPNIVTIHSVEEADGVHFMTMELVEGDPLSHRVRRGGMSAAEIFTVAIPVADALAAAHARGIVHRDIKPDNVMITREGRVKVLDFGLAKTTETAPGPQEETSLPTATVTQEGRILGTVAYMSPEQAEGRPVDPRSDVFSLGVVLYEMATGKRPFQGETVVSTITSIMRDTPVSIVESNPALPRHLGRIVTRCLMKDPERRYQSAKEVRNELDQLREETTSAATSRIPAEAATPSPAPPRRHGKPLVAIVSIGGLLMFALIAMLMLRGRAPQADRPTTAPAARAPAASAGPSIPEASIAVLPFTSVGADEESRVFAAGIHNDLLTQISKIGALKVISRTSVMEYRDTSKNLRQVAEELGVATVMEGSVQKAGTRLRINAQLVDALNDRHLWAETYDRELTAKDIFDVQGDIARRIAEALQTRLTPEQQRLLENRPTENLAAYEAYVQALEFDTRGEEESNARVATQTMEKAVSLDPGFALARAQLARLHTQIYWMHFDRSADRLVRARKMIDEAFRLDPDLAEAHMALGYYHYWGFLEYERALEEFAKASRTLSNDTWVLSGIGFVKRRQGRMDEALEYFRKTAEIDPRNVVVLQAVGDTLALLRQYDESADWLQRALDVNPAAGNVHGVLIRSHLHRGDPDAAREALLRAEALGVEGERLDEVAIQVEVCARDFEAALDRIDRIGSDVVIDNQFTYLPTDLARAEALRLMGDVEAARPHFDEALAQIEARLKAKKEDERLHSALGRALAGLGRREEAIRAGRRGVELLPVEKEAMRGTTRREELAAIHVMLGNRAEAMDEIEFLLSRPGFLSKGLLRIDPIWDPLRKDPRFARLAAE